MTETIKILERNNPAIIIFNLMVAHEAKMLEPVVPKTGDEVKPVRVVTLEELFPGLEPNGDATVVQVELIVNGVSLPVMDSLNEYWRRAEAELDQRAREMAAETLLGSRLQTVLDRLAAIGHEIHDELDVLFPGTKREDY